MSAGICGKRLGFEEILGSPTQVPSAKRSRCLGYGSPIPTAEFGFSFEDKVSILLRRFPSMDREVAESVLNSHDGRVEDAIKSLDALFLGDSCASEPVLHSTSGLQSNDCLNEDVAIPDVRSDSMSRVNPEGFSWVNTFVQEMMNASDLNDARSRAASVLESFEGNIVAQSTASKEQEISSLKEQLQCFLRDNQILKRAVTIQHERHLEYEDKLKEVQEQKNTISQLQDQIHTMELSNYTLKIHLQRAEGGSISGHFHRDVF